MARKKSEMNKSAEQSVAQETGKGGTARKAELFGVAGNEVSVHVGGGAPRLEELKAALVKGNVLLGSRSVVKSLKTGNPKAIFIALNCPDNLKGDITSSAKISGITIENFAGTAKQLGIFCGKPFSVASVAVLEEKKK